MVVPKKRSLYRYAVDEFVEMIHVLQKRQVAYKCNDHDVNGWNKFVDYYTQQNIEIDKSFYTSSLGISNEDFDDFIEKLVDQNDIDKLLSENKEYSIKVLMLILFNLFLPSKSFNSITHAIPTTSASHFFTNLTAASNVPPVANKSSMIITLSPFLIASS